MACLFCGREATLLCDFILGRDAATAGETIGLDDDFITCDAPICESCAKTVGHMCSHHDHLDELVDLCGACGNRRNADSGCDTIDLCPLHADVRVVYNKRGDTLDGSLGDLRRLLSATEVEAFRRRLRFHAVPSKYVERDAGAESFGCDG